MIWMDDAALIGRLERHAEALEAEVRECAHRKERGEAGGLEADNCSLRAQKLRLFVSLLRRCNPI